MSENQSNRGNIMNNKQHIGEVKYNNGKIIWQKIKTGYAAILFAKHELRSRLIIESKTKPAAKDMAEHILNKNFEGYPKANFCRIIKL